jgi:hypothetical protein
MIRNEHSRRVGLHLLEEFTQLLQSTSSTNGEIDLPGLIDLAANIPGPAGSTALGLLRTFGAPN